jgi:hypothetical protein
MLDKTLDGLLNSAQQFQDGMITIEEFRNRTMSIVTNMNTEQLIRLVHFLCAPDKPVSS